MEGIMTKYEDWLDRVKRTVMTRGLLMSRKEMDGEGIVEVINYETGVDDQMSVDERCLHINRQGRAGNMGRSLYIERAVKSVGEGGVITVYSGIVFHTEFLRNMYCMRRDMGFEGGTIDCSGLPMAN